MILRFIEWIWNLLREPKRRRAIALADHLACADMTAKYGQLNNDNAEAAVAYHNIRMRGYFLRIMDGENVTAEDEP